MNASSRSLPWRRLGPAALAVALACADAGTGNMRSRLQTESLLGEPLFDRAEAYGDTIASADSALTAQPESLDALLLAAGARVAAWKYREAIELYTRGVQLYPGDWRPHRHRGHRYISTRRFADAITDLERARALAPDSWDVAYHLGLAYFLVGRFDDAAEEYGRCMGLAADSAALAVAASGALGAEFRSCMENATVRPSRIAMSEWWYRALRRAGRHAEAAELLATVPSDWELETNASYYVQLLVYKGILQESDVLSMNTVGRFETRAYGLANWHLVEGDTSRALELLEEIAADTHWPGFGRIAAEADLARLR